MISLLRVWLWLHGLGKPRVRLTSDQTTGVVQGRDLSWADTPLPTTSIEGEYVPVEGDEVTYKVCPIPHKNQKFQAVEVVLTQLAPHTPHETWSGQVVGS